VTGDPLALARALRKVERAAGAEWGLLGPLDVRGDGDGPLTRLLATHPPMDDRVGRLVEKAEQWRGRDSGAEPGAGRGPGAGPGPGPGSGSGSGSGPGSERRRIRIGG